MEEDKAAAYYDELSRKGEGAARFKRGLGFSSSSSSAAAAPDLKRPASAATAFLSNFVRASSPGKAAEIQREAQIERIQSKLKKKPPLLPPSKPPPSGGDEDADRRRARRSRSRSRSNSWERYRDRRRSPGRKADRSPRRHHSQGRRRREDEDEEKYRSRRRRRSRSRSGSEERERSRQSRHGDMRERGDYSSRRGRGSRSPPSSPEYRAAERGRRVVNGEDGKKIENNRSRGPASSKGRNATADYSQLIQGYSQMTPAERVKAKMKFQLSKTVAMDMAKGITTGWERFQFDKEAPLDDEDIEVAEDDETLVKDIERSFRYSAVEAKREEDLKAAHDEAMFGVSVASPMIPEKEETEERDESKGASVQETLINEKARAIQGSWRDRIRRPQHGLGNPGG